MKRLIEQHQLLPVIMQMDRADDTVPVHIRPPVRIVDPETGLNGIIMRAVPDQVGRPFFLKIRNFQIDPRTAFSAASNGEIAGYTFSRSPAWRTITVTSVPPARLSLPGCPALTPQTSDRVPDLPGNAPQSYPAPADAHTRQSIY